MTDDQKSADMVELHFLLQIDDGWPPVALEGLPCTPIDNGFRVEKPPLFIKGISCGDVISISQDVEGNVSAWTHVKRSDRTTIWLLRMAEPSGIDVALEELRLLGCKTVQLPQYGSYSVDVPAECEIEKIDACLARLDQSRIAVAYSSFRHEEYRKMRKVRSLCQAKPGGEGS